VEPTDDFILRGSEPRPMAPRKIVADLHRHPISPIPGQMSTDLGSPAHRTKGPYVS
jgi:hypothetical protein